MTQFVLRRPACNSGRVMTFFSHKLQTGDCEVAWVRRQLVDSSVLQNYSGHSWGCQPPLAGPLIVIVRRLAPDRLGSGVIYKGRRESLATSRSLRQTQIY